MTLGLFALGACDPVTTAVTTVGGIIGVGVLEERTAESSIRDKRIQMSIHYEIDRQKLTSGSGVFVLVYESEVLLAGYVKDRREHETILKIVGEISEVRSFYDELIVGVQNSSQYLSDRILGVELSAKLSLEDGVNAVNYVIRIVDGIAYILGLSLSDDERQKVRDVASSIKGMRGVVSKIRVRRVVEQEGEVSQEGFPQQPAEEPRLESGTTGIAEETVNVEELKSID